MRVLYSFIFSLFFLNIAWSATTIGSKDELPTTGNFALPASQQPGPLVGLGQNIPGAHVTQLFLFADDIVGVRRHAVDIIPSVLYGITDYFSVFLNAPIAASFQQDNNHSAGFEDAFVQLEYAFYTKNTHEYQDQATVLGNMTFPTGSTQKNPATGVGSPSFLLGGTYNRTCINWFAFTSYGVQLNTTRNNTRYGNSYLYQGGIGRDIANINQWLFAWMIEGTGQFSEQNRIQGAVDSNSGGNIFLITPSFWASSKIFIIQLGVGFPATQHLFGNQTRTNYALVGNFGITV